MQTTVDITTAVSVETDGWEGERTKEEEALSSEWGGKESLGAGLEKQQLLSPSTGWFSHGKAGYN